MVEEAPGNKYQIANDGNIIELNNPPSTTNHFVGPMVPSVDGGGAGIDRNSEIGIQRNNEIGAQRNSEVQLQRSSSNDCKVDFGLFQL